MNRKIFFASGSKIGLFYGDKLSYMESNYLKSYKKNLKEIADRKAWKSGGTGAAFRGDLTEFGLKNIENKDEHAKVNGITPLQDGARVIYSIEFDGYSGIFIKSHSGDESEQHVLHGNKETFYNLDYNAASNELVVSMSDSSMEKHLAVMDVKNGHYHMLTEGDSIDENPVWSKSNPQHIYYDSKGIGRGESGQLLGYSAKEIYRLDLESSEIEEVVSIKNFDCFLPKEDGRENLYFIKKPYYMSEKKPAAGFKDFVLIPVKLLKAVFRFLEFFTMRYTGETFKTRGNNPAKGKQDPKLMFIYENLVNAEKNMEENRVSGEKYPGIAPRTWELVRLDSSGKSVTVKKGVIDFDITSEGEIIYSNGRYIMKLSKDGKEHMLQETELVSKIKVL
ncbi:MAG: hypothetical protein Q8930_11415 [Bacillota bacterium]|nr:hypothetical protein [Bacillota bacterium]